MKITQIVAGFFALIPTLVMIVLFMWFGWAVGGAIGDQFGTEKDSEESGGFWGALIALVLAVYFIFFA